MRIGLTGGFACGKTTVAHYFAALGITVIDADKIAADIVAKNTAALAAIIARFGADICDAQGHLKRKQLQALIFTDAEKRNWLENLLHPPIWEKMLFYANQANTPYHILAIPLLLEKNLKNKVDRVLVVDAPEHLQRERAQQRDHLTQQQINNILKTQLTRSQRLMQADDIIENNGDLAHLKQQVEKLHVKYLQGETR